MPVTIVCSTCAKSLKAPDHLIGKRVKCPGCGAPIQVNALAPAGAFADPFGGGAEPNYAADGGGYAPSAQQTGWGRYRLGLLIVAINTLATSGLIGLLFLIGILALSLTMLEIIPYVLLVGVLAQAVGFWFCSNIPRDSGERGMMQVAFWFFAPGALVFLLNTFLGLLSYFKSMELMLIFASVSIAGSLCMFAAQVFYSFSLRGVALSLKNMSLAKNVFAYLVYTAAFLPLYILYKGISAALAGPVMVPMGRVSGSLGSGPGSMPRGGPEPSPLTGMGGTLDLGILIALLAINVLWFAYILKLQRDLASTQHV